MEVSYITLTNINCRCKLDSLGTLRILEFIIKRPPRDNFYIAIEKTNANGILKELTKPIKEFATIIKKSFYNIEDCKNVTIMIMVKDHDGYYVELKNDTENDLQIDISYETVNVNK